MRIHPLRSARAALAIAVGLATAMATRVDRGGAQSLSAEVLTVASIADTYVDEALPGTNFNGSTRLRADGPPRKIVLVRFAVTGVGGRTVERARVQLRVASGSAVTGGTIRLVGDNTWNEATVTWNTRPPVDTRALDTLGPVATGEIVELAVDGAIGGDGLVSFAIDTPAADGVSYDSSAAAGGLRPRLALAVSAGPQPAVTIVQPPSGSTFFDGDAVPLQATVTDDADADLAGEVAWTSDRDGPLGTGGTIAPTLTLGAHRVTAAVTDRDGFSGSDAIDLAVVPPPPANTEPLVTITAPLDGQLFNASEPLPFAGSATDLEDGVLTPGLTWTSDRDGPIGLGGSFTAQLSEGRHHVTAAVTDGGGAHGAATVAVDMVPPISLEFAPVADAYVDADSPETNFGASTALRVDASSERIAYLRFQVSGVGRRRVSRATLRLQAAAASSAGSDSGGRVHRISASAWEERTVTWRTRPVVDGAALSAAGRVRPGDIVAFDVTGAVTADGTYDFALTTTSANAVDYRSREGGSPRLIVLLGGHPPSVRITAPADGTVVFTSALPLVFSGTAIDPEDGSLGPAIAWTSDRDGALGTGERIAAPLSVGTHRIRAAVTDGNDLAGEATITVRVRPPNTPPAVTITAPLPGTAVPAGTLVTLAASATDDFDGSLDARIAWRSDRDGPLGTGATRTVRLGEGTHTVTASVTDSDGAVGTAQASVTVTPTAPVVTITAPANGTRIFTGEALTLTATAFDATDGDLSASLRWTSDRDGTLGTGPALTTTTLSLGTHRLTARVSDRGGLAAEAAVVVIVRPPNVPPQVAITAPADGATPLPTVTLSGAATDVEDGDLGSAIQWRSSRDGVLGTGATLITRPLSPGSHTLTATVADSDGATTSASVTVTVRSQTLTFGAQADTCVDDSTPAAAYGSATVLRVDASPRRQIFVRFAVAGVPPFAVERAVLRLTVDADSASGSAAGGTVHRISDSTWSETTTYNSRPAVDGPALASRGAVAPGATVDFDVTQALGGDGAYDFALVTASSDAAGYRSRESATGRPQLILTLKENTPPVLTITAPLAGAVVPPGAPLTLGATATDAENGDLSARVQWTSDRNGPLGIGGSISAAGLSPGAHVITATATDTSLAAATESVPVVIESRPVVTITAPAEGSNHFVGEPVGFSASAIDIGDGDLGAGIAWTSSLDGPLGTGRQLSLTSLRLGTHTVTAAATDGRGFTGSATVTLTVEVNDPPAVTITAPAPLANFVEGRSVTCRATATDPEQGDLSPSIVWTSSRDGALGAGATLSTTRLSVGTHVITARAADNRNLQGAATVTVTVEANDPPLVTIAAPAAGAVVHMAAPVAFSATALDPEDGDLSSGIAWTSSRDGALGTGGGFTTTALSVGAHSITAAAVDTLGLRGTRQLSLQVVNDAPAVSVTSPPNGLNTYVGNPIAFAATARDTEDGDLGAGLLWTSSRDGALGSGPAFTRTTLSQGIHTITARVTDRGGATGTRQVSVTVRSIPTGTGAPVVAITAPANGATFVFGDRATFTATATDPDDGNIGASIVWSSSVDGLIGTGPSVVRNSLSIGMHRITATATDSHGIVRFAEIAIEIEEPNEPPAVTITAPSGGTHVNERDRVTFSARATDLEDGDISSRIEWSSDLDGPLGAGATLALDTLTPGPHTVSAAAIDSRGDIGGATVTLTVHPIPVVRVLLPLDGDGYLDSTPLSFFATAMDPAEGDVSASLVWTSSLDGPIGIGQTFTTDTLGLGLHTVTAMATNSRGGVGTGRVSFFIGRETLRFTPIADAYVDQGFPSSNFGADDLLLADAGPQVRESYLRFAVNGVGPLRVALADLRLVVSGSGGSSFGGRVHAVPDTGWQEGTVTYNTRPPVTAPALDVVGVSVEADEFVDFDVTSALGSDGIYAFALQSDSTDAVKYKSRESTAADRPQLVIQVAPPELEEIPEVTIRSPAAGITVFDDTAVPLVATASDPEDGDLTARIMWRSSRDGVLGTGGTLSVALSRGFHTITARAEDGFGLSATDAVSLTIVDRPPLVTITAPASGAFFPAGFGVGLRATASDDLDGNLASIIEWTSSRNGFLGTGPAPIASDLAQGDHRITATVINSLGTVGSATTRIFVGQAPPEVTILAPADGTTVSEGMPLALAGLATDVENGELSPSIVWSSDRQGPLGAGASVSVSLMAVGSHRITAAVTDSHGFTSTAAVTVIVASAPPAVTILAPTPDSEFTGPVAFQGTALDARDGNVSSGLAWRSSVSGVLGTGASLPARQLPSGVHVITAQVTDSNGLTGSATATIAVGAVPPTIRITSPVSSTAASPQISVSRGTAVTFSATATASGGANLGSSVQWRSSISGTLGTGASITTSSLARGRHVITAKATDANGLSAAAAIVVTVTGTITNTAPVVTITKPAAGSTVMAGNPVTFSATAVDDAAGNVASALSWVSSLEGLLGTGASVTTSLYRPGTHTVRAMVADGAGFVGSATVSVSVEAPSLTFEAVADTYTDAAQPASNFGGASSLRVDTSPEQGTYLRFAVSGLAGRPIQSAVVRLQVSSQSGSSSNAGGEIRRVSDTTWNELGLAHVNRPAPDPTALASVGSVATSQTVDFNVTPAVTGDGVYSFAVLPRSSDAAIYQSREASVGRPRLVVFLAPPARPAPSVKITAPANLATLSTGSATTFRATATDAGDGDRGATVVWTSNASGTLAAGASVSLTLAPGPHVITATATDTAGNAGADRVHVMVGSAPQVEITAPADGSAVPFGQPVVLSGTAFDLQDGDLSAQMRWSSSRDGTLGTGPTIAALLSPGAHTITASAADSGSQVGAATRSVSVTIGTVGFRGASFGSGIDSENNRLTASKPESKLWYTSDGVWWGVLYKRASAAFRIHRLDFPTETWIDTGVFVDERSNSRQDALLDGDTLYVLSRFGDAPAENRLLRYTYRPTAQTWALDAGYPVAVPGGGTEAATIAKDSTGTLWVAFTLNDQVWVSHTLGSERDWAPAFVVPVGDENPEAVNVSFDDIAGIIALDGRIGVFWTNQATKRFYFAVHTDGAAPDGTAAWSLETAASGGSIADDHFNMKLASDGRLFVAVKTSFTSTGQTLVGLLVRSATGTWSALHNVARVEQNPTRPLCLLDEVRRKVHVFYSLDASAVYTKTSSMDTIAFPDAGGPGTPFITSSSSGDINNPTSTKQNVTPGTGYVALASSPGSHYYWHNALEPKAAAVTIAQPADGAKIRRGATVTFSGSAFSYNDGPASGSLVWTSNRDGLLRTGASFSTSTLTEGVHVITAALTDSAGITGSRSITIAVETDRAPLVIVATPTTGRNFAVGETIVFSGTAWDSLDGALTSSIQWTSSRDGALGTGGTISRSTLSTGTHTITARATDSGGLVGSASVTIDVQSLSAPAVQITAPAGTASLAFGGALPFAGTATDAFDGDLTAALRWFSSRDGAIGAGGGFTRSSLSRGTHTITATVTDSHGLTGTATVTVSVN